MDGENNLQIINNENNRYLQIKPARDERTQDIKT